MALQVVYEHGGPVRANAPLFQQVAEHARDDVLPAVEEAGHNRDHRGPAGDVQRVASELTDERRHLGVVERPGEGGAVCEGGLEKLEACRTGANLPHRSKVKLEMAYGFSFGADIGFLTEHDLIDQLRGLRVSRRQPRDFDTGEVAL